MTEEQQFRQELSDWLIDNYLCDSPFQDETEEAVVALCLEYPDHVRKMMFEFLDKFENNGYVQNLKNKIIAQSL